MTAIRHELRDVSLADLSAMLDENIAEYRALREAGIPAHSPDFEENCLIFLALSDAMADRTPA